MTIPWTDHPLTGLDLETTGPDPMTARIVSACIVSRAVDGHEATNWLLDPGIEIPLEATAIHGITTAAAQLNGLDYALGYADLRNRLERAWALGHIVVAYNASYDMTVIDQQGRRLGYRTLVCGPIADPYVIDRELDRYRRGKRTLTVTCDHYGVILGAAHNAAHDASAAVELTRILAQYYPAELARLTAPQLMTAQSAWHHDRQTDFAAWLRRSGKDASDVNGEWPLRTA
ncbi:exonuclease domain-containing protein [Nocardia sp. NPDC088792]|uniref:exonuclease domain-containing protein n=1 Tax=Nocardia sp. NPDC088792 TaxID=3364332 RepID=UPI003812D586